nr:glycosyltransferase family 39 protein [Oscillochloris sp. ZM17-4]
MSSASPAAGVMTSRLARWWPAAAIFGVALALRLYRLGSTPLWLDEIYTIQLARMGPWAIWRNLSYDPHPALFYLSEWLISGFGAAQPAWVWRMIPMLCGVLIAPLVYWAARPLSGPAGALVGGLVMALSPISMYFSQEARSATLALLLSGLCLTLALALIRRPRADIWAAYGIVSFLGLATSYLFVIVPGAQLLMLIALRSTRRAALWCSAALAIAGIPLLLIGRGVLAAVASEHAVQSPPSMPDFLMALVGGDSVRYGQTWAHGALLGAILLLAAAGVWAGRSGPRQAAMLLCLVQFALPLLGFFGVGVPLLGLRLPLSESKTFMPLLPALLVLVAMGAAWLLGARPLGAALLVGLVLLIVAGSAYNLGRYWETSKSPESDLVLAMARQSEPGDVVISLYPSLNGAMSIYAPAMDTYTMVTGSSDARMLSRSLLILRIPELAAQPEASVDAAMSPGTRIWLLYNARWPLPPPLDTIAATCTQRTEFMRPPFHAILVTDCP